mmetsp:Transcript_20751/g.46792  ORF Transcript_20751/g.46792 Transcript_20751/m.46792 type:complete len:105 (+) Transcript_20751:62-376(+)
MASDGSAHRNRSDGPPGTGNDARSSPRGKGSLMQAALLQARANREAAEREKRALEVLLEEFSLALEMERLEQKEARRRERQARQLAVLVASISSIGSSDWIVAD